jgi:uncharacterized membrane protein (UPF0127 family)
MAKLSTWPTYTLLGAFMLAFVVFAGYAYLYNKEGSSEVNTNLATIAKFKTSTSSSKNTVAAEIDPADWIRVYPNTKDMMIGTVPVKASVAKTWPERIQGLSGTPFLPEDVVKLFIFDSPGLHSIWMKDMLYAIDIIWVNAGGEIVSIKESATPESFPESFLPEAEAVYVIETAVGFSARHNLKIGDMVTLPFLE